MLAKLGVRIAHRHGACVCLVMMMMSIACDRDLTVKNGMMHVLQQLAAMGHVLLR